MMQGFEVFNKVLTEITQKIDAMNNKTVEITAPSGGTYEGTVQDGNIEITAPSGAKYTGNVTQH